MRVAVSAVFDRWFPRETKFTPAFLLRSLLLFVGSGLLLGLAFPTFDLFPLAWFVLAPPVAFALRYGPWRVWLCSFLGGMAYWLSIAYWMHTFHPFALVSAIPVCALYFSLPFLLTALWRKRIPRLARLAPLVFAVSWLGVEYFRSIGFLAFSWGVLGYSQYRFLPLIQIADLFGVLGVSGVLIIANTVLAVLLDRQEPGRVLRRLTLGAAVIFILVLGYGFLRLTESVPPATKRLALIQGFTDPAQDWRGRETTRETMRKIDLLTRIASMRNAHPDTLPRPELPAWFFRAFPRFRPPGLVIWSETLMARRAMAYWRGLGGLPPEQLEALRKRDPWQSLLLQWEMGDWFRNLPARLGVAVLLTAPDQVDGNSHNSAFLVDGSGRLLGEYRKIKLVPFGEHFPYDIPFIQRILAATIASSFTAGEHFTVFRLHGTPFSVVICFEDIFGDICRIFVRDGAGYLINTTNDYWSRSLKAQIQHFSMSIFRAVENRRYLVRAANTGVTTVIDAWGRVGDSLENNVVGILQTAVPDMSGRGRSLYTAVGDLPGYVMLFLTVFIILLLLPPRALRRRAGLYFSGK